ncbi:SNF2-type protein [Gaiella occulta]|uniref:SNF2-type protein n=1 Tax=Gaiella occulta TaxID=1002870 RepID=A0A7M2YYD3_9ACTN|nr:DEAD/DEAH box helicase [Gaiella occulta]RDI74478.1 SNF2-type protein [Gaiella occulta]
MSTPEPTIPDAAPALAAFELLWQQDATAYAFARAADGSLSAGHLHVGMPAVADLAHLGHSVTARRVALHELLRLADSPPDGLELGDTARATFAVVEIARRSVAEGLVHPQLQHAGGAWLAFWGATLDASVQAALAAVASALPAVCADPFDGDPAAAVHDLYACAVDQIARDRLRSAGVRLGRRHGRGRPSAVELFLDGLAAPDPELAPHSGYAALERRLSAWVDRGLAGRTQAPWTLALRLDERDDHALALELWLQAADDPTLGLPASMLWEDGDEVFSFLRAGDPRRLLQRRLAEIEPILAAGGIGFDLERPADAALDEDAVRYFLREAKPQLDELGVPVLLPTGWVRSSSPLRVNLSAGSEGPRRSSGLLSRDALASFAWQLAIGDTLVSEEELRELAAAKEPLIRVGGRWHALRQTDVDRALRFLERRRSAGGIVDLVRAVSGVETDEAGLELGEVFLDATLAALLQGGDERRFDPLPTPAGMTLALFPFQERGHGWLRLLGDLGIGAILADDMGLGKTVQAIAMLLSEREEHGAGAVGPTLVVCPMSVTRQWAREIARFAPSLRVHVHHGTGRLAGPALVAAAQASDVVVTSYDVATRDVDDLAQVDWDRLLLDEAQDVKNPATRRARALRRLPARRKLAMTGTPIENNLGELWALMDIVNPGLLGSRDRFERTFARPIELAGDERALERLRAVVGPFILRRPKDAPEVELELPRITVAKQRCRLTVEQAGLYRATVDRWMPRIEEHERSFGRRGAVLAMLSQLKQVCNHPELIVATGQPLDGRSGKLERLVELLRAVPHGDKALVFTQYPGFDRLAPHLAERLGRGVGFFHGGLGARRREELVESFGRDDGPAVLVISIRAGGRGLNLPMANHVFHFDRWWNPAVEQQATDRAYRFGQRKDVFVHSLICTATLEERIDELLESKRELAAKVIAGRSEDWLGELDLDAIRAAVALAPDAVEEAAA